MPERVEHHEPDGVDYGWVMQTTFVVTILVGAPIVALLSLVAPPQDTWAARAEFALRVGAVVWLVTSVAVYLYAARVADADDSDTDDSDIEDSRADDPHVDEHRADDPDDRQTSSGETENADADDPDGASDDAVGDRDGSDTPRERV